MNSIIFWIVTPCSSEKAQRFGRIYPLHLQGLRAYRLFLLVLYLTYSSSLKIEVINFSETSGCHLTTQHYNSGERIVHHIRKGNCMNYIVSVCTCFIPLSSNLEHSGSLALDINYTELRYYRAVLFTHLQNSFPAAM